MVSIRFPCRMVLINLDPISAHDSFSEIDLIFKNEVYSVGQNQASGSLTPKALRYSGRSFSTESYQRSAAEVEGTYTAS